MGSFSMWHWLILLAFIAIIFFVVRYAARQAAAAGPAGPTGVGGWLIIPIIGFVGVILLTGKNLISALGETEGLKAIFFGTSPELDVLRLPIFLSLAFAVALIISAAICLYKIAFSRVSLRNIAVTHYVLLAIAGLVEYWGDGVISTAMADTPRDPTISRDAVRGIVAACIWIPYFVVSKRIANTFEGGKAASVSTGAA